MSGSLEKPVTEFKKRNTSSLKQTQQKRMCHVISAVRFVRQIKKKNPAWICIIKPSDVDKSTKKTKVEVDCSELSKEFADVEG